MRRSQRMSGLMPDDAAKLRLWRVHCESLKVHCCFVGRNTEDIYAQVRPVTAIPTVRPRDAYLRICIACYESHIAPFVPGIHMRQDSSAECDWRIVQEADCQSHTFCMPILRSCY